MEDFKQIDIIVEARMNSSRLPSKVLLPAVGKPLLELMIERLRRIPNITNIIIATPIDSANDPIANLATKLDVHCFRGDEDDVLGRVLNAAHQFKTDVIVEITGDNPLIDPDISSQIIREFLDRENVVDYVSNDVGHHRTGVGLTFPFGFNTKVFKTSILEWADRITSHPVDREHVVNYIVKNLDISRLYNVEAQGLFSRKDIRLTLDTPEDYYVIKAVFEALYPANPNFNAMDIITFLDSNPNIRDLNRHVVQRRYEYEQ